MLKKIILGVVGLFVLLVIIGVASNGGSKKVGTNEQQPNQQVKPQPSKETKQEPYRIGDKIQMGKVILTINKIETSQGGQYSKPSQGNQWINLNLTIENTGSSQEYVSTLGQMFIMDDQSNQFQVAVTNKRLENAGSMGLDGAIVATAKKTDWVGFEVPTTAKGLKFQYNASFFSNNKILVDLGI